MDNFNILSNENIQTVNLDLNSMNNYSDIGVELLVNSEKTINTNKEDINLFSDTAIDEGNTSLPNDDNKNISFGNDILPNDPILSRNDSNDDDENSEFKPIYKMSPQDIKNEKIDLI